jgi:hypothetical protein|tara:strand:+ start:26 stop:289 length:264 start_codon:yes stop_codon:yes gene_type:complete
LELKFKYYSIQLNNDEVDILNKLVDEEYPNESFAIDDWIVIDLLYKKHIIVYDKTREKKPEIQPWCRSIVLRTLLGKQSGVSLGQTT